MKLLLAILATAFIANVATANARGSFKQTLHSALVNLANDDAADADFQALHGQPLACLTSARRSPATTASAKEQKLYTPLVQMHGLGDAAKNRGMMQLRAAIAKHLGNDVYVTNVQSRFAHDAHRPLSRVNVGQLVQLQKLGVVRLAPLDSHHIPSSASVSTSPSIP
jgi:hypothetical protein